MRKPSGYLRKLIIILPAIFILFLTSIALGQDTIQVVFGNPDGSPMHWPLADTARIPLWVSPMQGSGGAMMQLYINSEDVSDFIGINFYYDWEFHYSFVGHWRVNLSFIPGICPDSLNHIADYEVMATSDSSLVGDTVYAFIPGTIVISDTFGYHNLPYDLTVSPIIIDPPGPLGINENVFLPEKPLLYGNYPNPFNSSTAIRFYLPTGSNADLSIYNISGQAIRKIHLERSSAGEGEVIWDGRGDNNDPVSSGIYFYSIRAGDYSASAKMTLLK